MRIILIGYGVVGRSFTSLLEARRKVLLERFGIRPEIVAIVDRGGAALSEDGLNPREMKSCKEKKGSVAYHGTHGRAHMSGIEVVEEEEADVVIETTQTNIDDGEPGLSHIRKAMRLGRHVITTNKGPLAVAMPLLSDLAQTNRVIFRFSGTVGGGTPVLDFTKKCLQGDEITEIRGILNGTTNYILGSMEEGLDYESALADAQRLGFAESDPRMDVDGIDAGVKLVILANWVMNRRVTMKDVDIGGIRDVGKEDFIQAGEKGCTVKLIGSIDGGLCVKVRHVPKDSPLNVKGALNAIIFVSRYAGEETIVGKGAGGMETASAVLRDLIDIKSRLMARQI